jgi:phenylalanyl-tRNA synthetase beta chain
MKVPLSWLRELVEINVPVPELAQRLTMAGLEVEDVLTVGSNWQDIVIGRVLELEKHPRLDNLNVARIDLGNGRGRTVVTGAPNLHVGDIVPHVAPGGRLPGGEVGSRTFSGITSEGMVCSGDELDISPDKDGIYVFEPEATIGQSVAEYLDETVLDIYINPNRPDCMSLVGVAREVHALFEAAYRPAFLKLFEPSAASVAGTPGEPPVSELLDVRIDDPVGCPRFTASIVRGIQIGPSPLWLQRRLHFCGVRPISNVVDVTNYVMLEVGQPLHAFDRQRFDSKSIVVRRATQGERIGTLDGEQRQLSSSMMVVTDGQSPRSLAGIMGGEDSEIADTTREVILEGANWDRATIRLTSSALNLSSEASRRFGRGVDPDVTALAVARATQLTVELAGGAAAAGLVDVYPESEPLRSIDVTPAQIGALMGMEYPKHQIVPILDALGFQPVSGTNEVINVTVPGWRRFDVEGRADIAEEVGRVVGYEMLPSTMLRGRVPEPRPDGDAGYHDELRARRALTAAGVQEAITYSLVDPEQARLFSDDEPIRIENPQSVEQSVLRTSLIGSLLTPLRTNLRQRDRVLLFEIARIWRGALEPLPQERRHVGIAISGPRLSSHWSGSTEPLDFFDLKGTIDALCQAFRVTPTYAPARHASLHPGRTAEVWLGDERLGMLGQLHPAMAERFDLASQPVLVAELDFETLLQARHAELTAVSVSRFPNADRDVSVIVPESAVHSEVERVIREAGQPLLENVRLFDLYHGEAIPPGHKSMAYSLRYRAADRTLEDQEVAATHARVEEALRTRFGAEVRGR